MSSAADSSVGSIEQRPPRARWLTRPDLAFAIKVALALAAVGAVLGWPWQHWSPRTIAVVDKSARLVPADTEAYIAGDGRFVIITGVVGLLAGTAVWLRRGRRGPVAGLGLAVGGAAGAYLTDVVGRLASGGSATGPVGQLVRPPVELHAVQFLAIEPLLALLVYTLYALFAAQDDLGRDDRLAP